MSIGFPDLSLIMIPRGSLTWHNFEASILLNECCQVHAHNSLITASRTTQAPWTDHKRQILLDTLRILIQRSLGARGSAGKVSGQRVITPLMLVRASDLSSDCIQPRPWR